MIDPIAKVTVLIDGVGVPAVADLESGLHNPKHTVGCAAMLSAQLIGPFFKETSIQKVTVAVELDGFIASLSLGDFTDGGWTIKDQLEMRAGEIAMQAYKMAKEQVDAQGEQN